MYVSCRLNRAQRLSYSRIVVSVCVYVCAFIVNSNILKSSTVKWKFKVDTNGKLSAVKLKNMHVMPVRIFTIVTYHQFWRLPVCSRFFILLRQFNFIKCVWDKLENFVWIQTYVLFNVKGVLSCEKKRDILCTFFG